MVGISKKEVSTRAGWVSGTVSLFHSKHDALDPIPQSILLGRVNTLSCGNVHALYMWLNKLFAMATERSHTISY